jgi:GNAT superfamily N-acetyltransferase
MSYAKLDSVAVRSPEFQGWYLRLLEELAKQGSEVAATEKNAAFFCRLLGDLSAAGMAAVVAGYDEMGKMIGFGGAYSTGFDASCGGQLWTALGTYVAPEHRGNGCAKILRQAAQRFAKKCGASCATTGRYIGQEEELHDSMRPIQTLYLVTL